MKRAHSSSRPRGPVPLTVRANSAARSVSNCSAKEPRRSSSAADRKSDLHFPPPTGRGAELPACDGQPSSAPHSERCQIVESRNAGQEEVFAPGALHECLDVHDRPQRRLVDCEGSLWPNKRIGFIEQRREIAIEKPPLLDKFKLARNVGVEADEEQSTIGLIVRFVPCERGAVLAAASQYPVIVARIEQGLGRRHVFRK